MIDKYLEPVAYRENNIYTKLSIFNRFLFIGYHSLFAAKIKSSRPQSFESVKSPHQWVAGT